MLGITSKGYIIVDFKLLGSILLIVGTSIGAGMLALPIATAQLGFVGSLILLVVCWAVMTVGAFLILEVSLWLPTNSNMISMASTTLGPVGQVLAWITYLLLLYSLLCAYIAGGSDLFHYLLDAASVSLPRWLGPIIFTIIFGAVVFCGIHAVDYTNRALMFLKFTAYFLLVIFLTPHVTSINLFEGDLKELMSASAITVTVISFGFAAIVPSLRIYFGGDIKKLKKAILIGSLIPLFCYAIWDAVIMGVIPLYGEHGLREILGSDNSTSGLVATLTYATSSTSINLFAKIFTSICVLTSFLGVSLCLVDFLADGLHQEKTGLSGVFIHLLTLVPPVIVVIFYPKAFIKALEYGGIYCLILLVLLPAWMAWRGRYYHRLYGGFRVFGGRIVLAILIIFSLAIIGANVLK